MKGSGCLTYVASLFGHDICGKFMFIKYFTGFFKRLVIFTRICEPIGSLEK